MKTVTTIAAKTQITNDLINNAIRGLKSDIVRLREMILMHPKDSVVIAKDRMHVVQRDGDMAKIAVYPQLPAIFYSAHTARQIVAGFKCYKGDSTQIKLEAVNAADFAQAAINDLNQQVIDLYELLSTK